MSLCGVLVLPEGLVLPDPAVRARVARLLRGGLGLRPTKDLMAIMLANAVVSSGVY